MPIQNIGLVGAKGNLGPSILSALQAHPTFVPYVLNRHSSKSVYPKTRVITVPDELNVGEVSQLLRDHQIDALVIAIAGSYVEEQKKLIDAAFNGGVERLIPAEFGSCDSADEKTLEILPLMKGKKDVRDYLVEVCSRDRAGGKLTWTSLVSGHFFDWGLADGFLRFYVKEKKAYISDGGDIKFSASNLGFIAKAVVKILEKEEETENKLLYVHSNYVTQNEILAALEKATGGKWEAVQESSEDDLAITRKKMLDGDEKAVHDVVAVHGIVASDWSKKDGFANELLGLKEEPLDEVVARVIKEATK